MSIRTVIEINHDYLSEITPEDVARLMNLLAGAGINPEVDPYPLRHQGVRILGQRHHSETLNLKVR